jgi:hypothetical protein
VQGGRELTQKDGFIWVSIAVMYIVVFLPFFFSSIRIGNFSEKIPSLAMVWLGGFLYIPASIIVIVLLVKVSIPINTAIIIQAVLVFFFAIDIYLGYFANFHTVSVAREESSMMRHLTKIKSKALSLSLAAGELSPKYEDTRKILKQALDDIKYITPVQNDAGTDLETRIISALDSISDSCAFMMEGVFTSTFEDDVNELQALVKERKLLRN